MIDLALIEHFEWDDGNARTNDKPDVAASKAERVFFNQPLLMPEDANHSQGELRFHALGMTHSGRKLHITFTVRGTKIRVISARDMHRKERNIYEQTP